MANSDYRLLSISWARHMLHPWQLPCQSFLITQLRQHLRTIQLLFQCSLLCSWSIVAALITCQSMHLCFSQTLVICGSWPLILDTIRPLSSVYHPQNPHHPPLEPIIRASDWRSSSLERPPAFPFETSPLPQLQVARSIPHERKQHQFFIRGNITGNMTKLP